MLCADRPRMACRPREKQRQAVPRLGGARLGNKAESIKKNLDKIGTSAYDTRYEINKGKGLNHGNCEVGTEANKKGT